MRSPDGKLNPSEFVIEYESKSIRELKEVLKKSTPKESFSLVEKNGSNPLWKMLAFKALEEFDF